jgi:hypothetical protein
MYSSSVSSTSNFIFYRVGTVNTLRNNLDGIMTKLSVETKETSYEDLLNSILKDNSWGMNPDQRFTVIRLVSKAVQEACATQQAQMREKIKEFPANPMLKSEILNILEEGK